uniref:Uncharacterized protein n=1 Tax=Glycine max TaxID=3847 RepID=C6T0H5_SOYBN|nr:unknown [Glycine max]
MEFFDKNQKGSKKEPKRNTLNWQQAKYSLIKRTKFMIFKSPLSSFSTSEIIFILISSCRFLNLDLVTTPPKLRFSPFCSPASHLLFFFESLGLLSIPCRLIDASFGLSKKFRIRLVFIRRRFSHCQIYVKCYHHIDRYDSKKSAH